MMYKNLKSNQSGFTIVELMISTAVFAVVLLVVTGAVVQIGKMHYKGAITSRTQETTRSVIDSVTETAQTGVITGIRKEGAAPGAQTVCLGGTRYTYIIGSQVNGASGGATSLHGLWADDWADTSTCPPLNLNSPNPGGLNGRELLEENMQLAKFIVNQAPTGFRDGIGVTVQIQYGSDDLFNADGCVGFTLGGQFCASSELSSFVLPRR